MGISAGSAPDTKPCRTLWEAPFGLVGLHSTQTLRMQLFHSQQESLTEPFVKFQAGLQVGCFVGASSCPSSL